MSKLSFFILLLPLLLGSPKPLFAQDPEQEKFKPVYATVLANEVNIRAGRGLNFEVLGQLNKAAKVVVTAEEYGWYKIKLPREALCFVHKDYVNKGIVKVGRLRVRAGKMVNSNILGILKKGQAVDILEEDGEWLRIIPPVNCAGWVKKDYLQLSKKRFIPLIPKSYFSLQKRIKTWGTIDDLGKIFNRRGTHKLIEGKKILYYLRSKDINLNDYLYQKVCVIGKLENWENSLYSVINVEQIKAGQ